ncbi:MAG: hypothetical protein IJ054_06210, partial [Lachnospiraceae bacterium]|nr:hypothetical protein [Lachnospiraceae bacterium]
MVKLKKIVVYAACGLMLATAGNGFGSLNVSAAESKDVYSEKGIGDVEEQDSLYGYRSYKDGVKNIKKETHIAYYSDGTSEVTRVYEYDTNGILTSGMEKDPVNETWVPEFTNGLISSKKIYDEEGNLLRYYNYEYDSLQREIKCTRYAADGRLLGSNTTEYYGDSYNWYRITDYYSDDSYEISEFSNDSLNLCTATYNYESDGTLYSYSLNEHDANGNETKSTRYDAEGNVKWYYVNTYDERNMITSFLSYDEDGTLEYYDTYSYDFDADGDITREIQESSSGNTFVTVYEYYDSSVAQVVTDSIVTQGIYCSQTSPSIVAGLVV